MALSILNSCSFPFQYPTHGGIHRSEQILEILLKNGLLVTDLPQLSQPRYLRDRMVGAFRSLQDRDWDAFFNHRLGSIGQVFHRYQQALLDYPHYDAVVWETTAESVTPAIGKKHGIPVIAVPQQLESYFKAHFQKQPPTIVFDHLKREIAALKLANAVFAISAEDQLLLRNHGVAADYLPYYPSQRLLDVCSKIRQRRQHSTQTGFLILGSVQHHATRLGILELLNWIDLFVGTQLLNVTLIGNHTESLKDSLSYPWLTIAGTVSQAVLEQHLAETTAVLIHQQQGFGVLTRIPEMLAAGVPVIANRVAARSATHLPGVYVYDAPDELQHLLHAEFTHVPLPPPPKAAEQRFLQALSAA